MEFVAYFIGGAVGGYIMIKVVNPKSFPGTLVAAMTGGLIAYIALTALGV